jgi:ABC-type transporter Mla maintaining outer membrane lipid asymmetry permease subunit MlaE
MWGILALLIGFLYGWLKPGAQDKGQILVKGLIFGVIIGLVLAVLGYAIGSNPVYIGSGVLGIVLGVVIITLLFVLGVWIGDLVEGRPKRTN